MDTPQVDFAAPEFKENPLPILAELRNSGSLVQMNVPSLGAGWVATTYEAVNHVLRDQKSFVMDPKHVGKKSVPGVPRWLPRFARVFTNHMLNRDGSDHRRLRSLVELAFRRHSVDQMRDRLEALVSDLLDRMAEKADAAGNVDLMEEFARPFPLTVICEMLGLPLEDRPKFVRWAETLITARTPLKLLLAVPTFFKLNRYFRKQFRLCREQPREGLISALVEAEESGDRLNEDELTAMAFLLLIAGHETTVHLISTMLLTLLKHPAEKAELMADWSKAGTAVDESLRFNTPLQFARARYVRQDMEFHGKQLKRGEIVLPCLAAANSDPAEFKDPQRYDISRFPNHHLALGAGVHVCLGMKLTRVETSIAMEGLLTRFPNLKLSVPESEIPWGEALGFRGVKSLPVSLGIDKCQPQETAANLSESSMSCAC